MNSIDTQYQALLYHIKLTGTRKETRNGPVISTFGRQIRHNMAEGFPLLTTKKMYWKGIVAELLWFLKGQTDIRELWENDCHIWDGDYEKSGRTDFNLGPIYGKQWRKWETDDKYFEQLKKPIDQIVNLINDLKTNPDSRRLMVSAWNVGELDQMVLPPCHYGFQVYTRELCSGERRDWVIKNRSQQMPKFFDRLGWEGNVDKVLEEFNAPTRALSLMWNQRSVDTFLGLPFNIASYGLLLSILAELTNMIPDQLIGSLGDVHLYENHIDQAQEQLKRTPLVLPKLRINTEFWNPENSLGENNWVGIIEGMQLDDFQIEGYESYPAIKAPLSN